MQTNCVESCHAQTVVLMLDYNENCSKTKTRLIQFESCTRVRDDWACQVSVGQPSLTHACMFRVDVALCASELRHAKEQQFHPPGQGLCSSGCFQAQSRHRSCGCGREREKGKEKEKGKKRLDCLLAYFRAAAAMLVCLCCWSWFVLLVCLLFLRLALKYDH